jgi:1,2-dihydroxy-3-keto-5-methylthiopentene dioxygenase
MSRLTIWDATTQKELLRTEEPADIAEALKPIGVRFERWPVAPLPEGAEADVVLAAYKPHLDEFLKETKAGTADVIRLTADNPQRDAIRQKFLSEHIHTEDEVRFFHEGAGNFVMHVDGKVFDAHCTKGDLISVPANTKHWFDAGEIPHVTALRIFTDTTGWTPHYTGTDIAAKFPVVVG